MYSLYGLTVREIDEMINLPYSSSSNKSIVLITIHKAGSVYAQGILKRILESVGMPHVNIASVAYQSGLDEAEFCVQHSD